MEFKRYKRTSPEYVKYRRARRRRWISKYKKAKGCEECGYNKHCVALDFDHLDPKDKSFMPSARMMTRSLKLIFKEIRKCRILCANCHRAHTYSQYGGTGGSCGQ